MRRRFAGLAALLVLLYLATWLWGVPAVRRGLREAEVRELKSGFRELFPRASEEEIGQFDRQMEGLRFETYRAIPVLPGILMVEHGWFAGKGSPDIPMSRLVVWYGVGVQFLHAAHPWRAGA